MLRIATEDHIPAILEIYTPYILESTATFEYTAPTLEEFTQRFRSVTAQHPWLVWEEEGRVLGYAYASPPYTRAGYAWCAEPSIYLLPEAQGRGIGKRLYRALEAILSLQGYHILYALITAENAGSLAFHRSLGYTQRAEFPDCAVKFNRWIGLIWMEKRLQISEIPTAFPTPWSQFGQNDKKICDILYSLSLS